MTQNTATDLQQIQQALKAPKKHYNEFGKFKYRKFEDILEELKPLLCQYGCTLVLTDDVHEMAGQLVLTASARFTDSQGAVVEVKAHAGIESKKGMDMAQTFGVSSSYARKYALNGLFLIDDSNDPDTNEHQREVQHGQQQQNRQQQSQRGQQPAQQSAQQPQPTMKERYEMALKSIPNAKNPETLNKALAIFKNTQFHQQILNACNARADQMNWR
ncbi:ERF family protein [Acinetobacter thermotolerans]|uniref:ERF family protein n=1 Tax=Acinetobacter thermotolerans TaxID=3151487 RepID=UPI00325B0574